MLKLIDNRLTAEALYTLQKMGHGDVLIIADANFPSTSISKSTVSQSVLNMENLNAPEAIESILTLLPLDTFVDDFAGRMEVDDQPNFLPPVQQEVAKIVSVNDDKSRSMISIERQTFYEVARKSYAIVQTSETRLFGCFMLRKGVIFSS
jgi:L-fucose mutarotase